MYNLSHVSKCFLVSGKRRVDALQDISLSFPDHGLVFIVGKSGAGKSTLLNLLGLFLKPDQGTLTFEGEDASSFNQKKVRDLRREKIAFCFQSDNLDPTLTVLENILLAKRAPSKQAQVPIPKLLASLGLAGFEQRKAYELSGGEQQRVAIARALWKNADILLADEPTGALDSGSSATVFKLLKSIAQTRLVLVVSHDEEAAATYGERCITLKDGRVIADVTKSPLSSIDKSHAPEEKIRLSSRIVAKMGLDQLKRKPIQGVLPALLVACSVVMACFSLGLGIGSTPKTLAENIATSGANNLVLAQVRKNDQGDVTEQGSSTADAALAQEALGQEAVPLYWPENRASSTTFYGFNPKVADLTPLEKIVQGPLAYAVEATFENLATLHLSLSAGRLPQNDQEVALPICQYEIYRKCGFEYHVPSSTEDVSLLPSDIATPEAFLAKEPLLPIDGGTQSPKIVGFIDTGFSSSNYASDLSNNKGFFENAASQAYINELGHSLHRSVFYNSALIQKNIDSSGQFFVGSFDSEKAFAKVNGSSYSVSWVYKENSGLSAPGFRYESNGIYLPLGAAGKACGNFQFSGSFYDWSAITFPNLPAIDDIPVLSSLSGSILFSSVTSHNNSVLSLAACTAYVKANGLPSGENLTALQSKANDVYSYLYQKGLISKPIDFSDSTNAGLLASYYAYDLSSSGDLFDGANVASAFVSNSVYGRSGGLTITNQYLQDLFKNLQTLPQGTVTLDCFSSTGEKEAEAIFSGVVLSSISGGFDIAVGAGLYETARNFYPSGRYLGGFTSALPDRGHLEALAKSYGERKSGEIGYLLICSTLACYDTLKVSFSSFSNLLLGLAIGLTVFAVLLTMLFTLLSLRGKNKKAGLLCGLGAPTPLLYLYLSLEPLIICGAGFFTGLIASGIVVPVFNSSFIRSTGISISLLGFPAGPSLLFLLFVLLSLAVFLLFPTHKLVKESPTILMKRE